MKTYIIEIPVVQINEDADSATAANTIDGGTFISLKQLKDKLTSMQIDTHYSFTVANLVSHVNNGNDNFSDSYLASINIQD